MDSFRWGIIRTPHDEGLSSLVLLAMYDRNFKPNFFADITKAATVHMMVRSHTISKFVVSFKM